MQSYRIEPDGRYVYFTNLQDNKPAQKKAELNDVNFNCQEFIDDSIFTGTDCKNLSKDSVVYVSKLKQYAKVLEFDKEKGKYKLKLRNIHKDDSDEQKQDEETAEIYVDADDVSQHVSVKIIKSTNDNDIVKLKESQRSINIHEVILTQLGDVGKDFMFKGKQLDYESKAEELDITESHSLLAMGKGTAFITPKDWIRTKNYIKSGSFTCRSYYDAVSFKARGNTVIYGFMFGKEYENKDFTIYVGWQVDEGPWSEDVEFNIVHDDIGEDFIHRINFQEHGFAPIPLEERQKISFRVRCPNRNSFAYITDGYSQYYHDIEGQENMFWTQYCPANQNSTYEDYGMFPGILYHGGIVNDNIECYEEGEGGGGE